MTRVALATDPVFWEHLTGPGHPERPARLDAVRDAVEIHHLHELLVEVGFGNASSEDLRAVHDDSVLRLLAGLDRDGGGRIDADTTMSERSRAAALRAAGAGLACIDSLERGEAVAAFCAIRPPGHHATLDRSMGFCLINNVAVTASRLLTRGMRVAIVDFDAHHGNGTQDIFWNDPRVLFVSWHQWPLYPGSGRMMEVGGPAALGTTINLPMPAGSTGDRYRDTFDRVVGPRLEAFAPDWVLISAGFDAHRRDPLTDLGLTSGDFAYLVGAIAATAPTAGRVIAFLEGGYDLSALTMGVAATLSALGGRDLAPEPQSSGGPGERVADEALAVHRG